MLISRTCSLHEAVWYFQFKSLIISFVAGLTGVEFSCIHPFLMLLSPFSELYSHLKSSHSKCLSLIHSTEKDGFPGSVHWGVWFHVELLITCRKCSIFFSLKLDCSQTESLLRCQNMKFFYISFSLSLEQILWFVWQMGFILEGGL